MAAANAVAVWPDGNDGLSGIEASDPSPGRLRRPGPVEHSLEDMGHEGSGEGRHAGGNERNGQATAPQVGARASPTIRGPLTHHADTTTKTRSAGLSNAGAISTSPRSSWRRDPSPRARVARPAPPVLVVNGRASGIGDAERDPGGVRRARAGLGAHRPRARHR